MHRVPATGLHRVTEVFCKESPGVMRRLPASTVGLVDLWPTCMQCGSHPFQSVCLFFLFLAHWHSLGPPIPCLVVLVRANGLVFFLIQWNTNVSLPIEFDISFKIFIGDFNQVEDVLHYSFADGFNLEFVKCLFCIY